MHVIPVGVDTSYFDPAAVAPERTTPTVIFTGDMSYFPNQEAVRFFAEQALPVIRESYPDTRFLIVGRSPSKNVQQLRKIGDVEITGYVPDVRIYLAKAHVSVAPFTIAAGIQTKILEAMAYGLPVVATSRAKQGLSPGVSELVDTADSAEEMAGKVVRLFGDPLLADRRGADGRRRVATEYRWEDAIDRLMQLVENPYTTVETTSQVHSCGLALEQD